MPCHGPDPEPEIERALRKELDKIRTECDKVTRMLCELLYNIESNNCLGFATNRYQFSSELNAWWNKHKKQDEQRLKQKEAQQRAQEIQKQKDKEEYEKINNIFQKLTSEEITLLKKKL